VLLRKTITHILLAGCLLLFNGNIATAEPGPGRGKITNPVICLADSAQSYSLFLPSYYNEDDIWPVIFLFDPAGMGMRAMELFAPSAEEFGYILAASNTTENGPWDSFLIGANAMFRDVEGRFKIDPYRRYTAGFSGAAEAASGLAVMYDGIIGVIGCGSGFSPNYAPHFDVDFHYIGLIGDRDSHYQEMQNLGKVLERYHVDYFIQVYPGGHDWPPEPVIRDAFFWLEFKAMKHDIIAINDGMVARFYNENVLVVDSLENNGDTPGAYAVAQKIIVFLDGLKRMSDLVERKDKLYQSGQFAEFKAGLERIAMREKLITESYTEAFKAYKLSYADGMTPSQPLKWWKKEIKNANSMVRNNKNPLDTLLGWRIIDFIRRNAYSFYKSVEGTELYPVAIKYLEIWKAADPEAISPYYFSAVYYTRYNKYDKAIENIHQAVNFGLEDPTILQNDPVLQLLTGEPEYNAILDYLWARQDPE